MGVNLELIRATYEGKSEDNGRNLLAVLAPDASWTEAEGFPYAGTYIGADAIITGIFHRLGTEWIDYRAQVHTYMEDGDKVAAFGMYSGIYKATGKAMQADFVHFYVVQNGQIQSMKQYVDTTMVNQALI